MKPCLERDALERLAAVMRHDVDARMSSMHGGDGGDEAATEGSTCNGFHAWQLPVLLPWHKAAGKPLRPATDYYARK